MSHEQEPSPWLGEGYIPVDVFFFWGGIRGMPCQENLVKQWENDEDNYHYFSKGDFYLPKICMYVATGWLIILLTIEIMKSHIVQGQQSMQHKLFFLIQNRQAIGGLWMDFSLVRCYYSP